MTGKRRRRLLVGAALVAVAAAAPLAAGAADSDRSNEVKAAIDGGTARNVILLIGDGLGDSEITAARNYAYGAAGRMALDTLPLTGAMTTYSVLETAPTAPDYTPESASTATGWSTGTKTADGRISTTPGTDTDLATVLDDAEEAGLRTGIVTTSEVTDATPAAPMSHVAARACQGPANMATCPQDVRPAGPGSIAEQSIDHQVDVILGGGRARYAQTNTGGPYAGQTVLQQASAEGYTVVGDRAGLAAASPGTPLLGLFNNGNMATRWTGQAASNPPSGPQRCTEANPAAASEPTLAEMTTQAIDLLDTPAARGRGGARVGPGFFLQVESASIDKRDHLSQPCEQIGETVNFDEAVAAALDFARRDGNTLVIVTGDHAHTSQIVEPDATPAGFSSILTTDEGQPMMITYGTGNTPTGQEHTGSQIRIAAEGPQAANVVGVIDQTDIAGIMRRALDLQ